MKNIMYYIIALLFLLGITINVFSQTLNNNGQLNNGPYTWINPYLINLSSFDKTKTVTFNWDPAVYYNRNNRYIRILFGSKEPVDVSVSVSYSDNIGFASITKYPVDVFSGAQHSSMLSFSLTTEKPEEDIVIAPYPLEYKDKSLGEPGKGFYYDNTLRTKGTITVYIEKGENSGSEVNPPIPSSASKNQNYIRTTTYTKEDAKKWVDNIQYFDGLGRPNQLVQVGITPNKKDLVTIQEYDNFGRESNSWLPGLSEGNGAYVTPDNVKTSAKAAALNNDVAPYSKSVYEASPLNRVTAQFGPGNDWHTKGKAVHTGYLTNKAKTGTAWANADSLVCALYKTTDDTKTISLSRSGNYAAGELYVTRIKDEDGSISYEFKDKLGQVVLTRQINNGTRYDTNYIYDSYGNLRAVLPPEASDKLLSSTNWGETDTNLKLYAYLYKYDSRNRCIYKKLPGAEPIHYVYDKADRLIFTQDGEQKAKNEWTFSIPDVFGRVVLTGTCTTVNKAAITSGRFDDWIIKAEFSTSGTHKRYNVLVGKSSFSALTIEGAKILSVNYYDNYDFRGMTEIPSSGTEYAAESGYGTHYTTSAKGLLTGTLTAQMTADGKVSTSYLYSVMYYDNRGRLIQTKSNNHLSGGIEKEYIAYDFVGNPTQKKHVHSATNKTTQTEVYKYTYDHAGRLLKTTHQLTVGTTAKPMVTLAENTYDELGRLKTNMKAGKLNTTYAYNVRSWTKSIDSKNGSTLLFNQNLFYNDTYGGGKAQYSGNISAMNWKIHNDSRTHGYAFAYDELSRINTATYLLNGTAPSTHNYKVENIAYDKHGNIKGMKRYGKTSTGETYALIDNLTMDYNGNQLTRVTDVVTGSIFSASSDFKDKTSAAGTIEYTYNKNGAMRSDLNKGITSIDYNSLNLPRQMVINGSSKAKNYYTYSASGVKLKTEQRYDPTLQISPVGTTTPSNDGLPDYKNTDYVGNIIYETSKSGANTKSNIRILVDGGYIEGGVYYFYLTDHLGNNRIVANASGTVIQKNHYYPFGMAFAETPKAEQEKQPYKYNGKELDQMHGLNLYDYSARYYEPAIGRFTTIDPHAENYYSWSPYHYGGNNPILNIDPDGRDYWSTSNQDEIERFLLSMQSGASTHDFSGWSHVSDKDFISSLDQGNYTINDETGMLHMSIGFVDNGAVGVLGISVPINIKPGATIDRAYPGAFVYSYNNDFLSFWGNESGGRLYADGYNALQRSLFSDMFPDAFDPTYYYDGATEWSVDYTGRIIGEYDPANHSPVFMLGGKGGKLGFKAHRKGKNWQKHSAPRSGGDPASGRYGQSRNKNKGDSNKKYIPPKNPNKRK